MKTSGPRFLTTDSISSLVISLFKFSVFMIQSQKVVLSKNFFISSKLCKLLAQSCSFLGGGVHLLTVSNSL